VSSGEIRLEATVVGDWRAGVLTHGALIADALALLLNEPVFARHFQLISYHRRGFAGSTHPQQALSMSAHASDCRALLDWLRVDRAHVVGHSLGGVIALQLALDAPEKVHTLTLLACRDGCRQRQTLARLQGGARGARWQVWHDPVVEFGDDDRATPEAVCLAHTFDDLDPVLRDCARGFEPTRILEV
jgi:pimeloyl-ACP methyl ester carboxylesterase